jgi:hypothetical protein
VDANGSGALTVTDGATLNAKSVSVSGGVNSSNGTINATNGVKTGQAAVANPYSSEVIPSFTGCNYGSLPSSPYSVTSGTQTLSPGVYCGGLWMGNSATVVMNAGVYIIDGGYFSVQSVKSLTGTGVTVVLTGSGSNYATVDIANGAPVTLSAPTTGATAGLVFFQDPNAPNTGTNTFAGGAAMVLTGALYFPDQTVNYSNGTSSTSACTQLIAWQMQFTGGASFNSNCAGAGTKGIGTSPSLLVE